MFKDEGASDCLVGKAAIQKDFTCILSMANLVCLLLLVCGMVLREGWVGLGGKEEMKEE